MLRRLNDLHGYGLEARDGAIGRVQDFYFDDRLWVVRYLVVNTGTWLGRDVLISPQAVTGLSADTKIVAVDLTRDQVEKSPSANLAQPLSRRYETQYYSYFGYEPYWAPVAIGGVPATDAMPPHGTPVAAHTPVDEEGSHVHSANEVKGYHIEASDGEIGHVDNFLVDDTSWAVRFLEVDTSNWIGGTSVLIPRRAIADVKWARQLVSVALTRSQVENSPRAEGVELTTDYERLVDSHYDIRP